MSVAEIRATFAEGWRIDSIEATRFATRDPLGGPRAPHAWLASMTRLWRRPARWADGRDGREGREGREGQVGQVVDTLRELL